MYNEFVEASDAECSLESYEQFSEISDDYGESSEASEQLIDQISENSDDYGESSEASEQSIDQISENSDYYGESSEDSEQFIDQISENSDYYGESSEASELFIDQISENSDDNHVIRDYGESSKGSDCNPWLQFDNVLRYSGGERLGCNRHELQKHREIVESSKNGDDVAVKRGMVYCNPEERIRPELQKKPCDSGMINDMSKERVSTHLDDRIKREIDCFRGIKELEDRSRVNIILEYCVCNLKDFIKSPNLYSTMEFWKNRHASVHLVNLMRGIVDGVKCLHQSNIVHRDIKPENILIIKTTNGELCAKIADLGMSKILSEDNASLTRTRHACGTLGWSAPELSEQRPHTKAVDIFSLGCVLFYCCTKGKLPFGINENRKGKKHEDNVEDRIYNLSLIKDQLEARDLIVHLLNNAPNERPTAEQTLKHPFFWTAKRKLEFMKDASDRVLKARIKKETALLTAVEGCLNLTNGSWDTNPKWDKRFLQRMFKFPRAKYDKKKVSSLLRIIRNGLVHFNVLPPSVQAAIGNSDEAQEAHFSGIFPDLMFNVYQVLLYGRFEEDPKLIKKNNVDLVIDKYKWL